METNGLKIWKVKNNSIVGQKLNITGYSGGITSIFNIDKQGNLYFYSKDDKSKTMNIFKVNTGATNAQVLNIDNFKIKSGLSINFDKNDNLLLTNDFKFYQVLKNTTIAIEITGYIPKPAPTPTKPMPTGEIIVIVASSLIALGIFGFGGYFIYYDRKHHVVKKWWKKRKSIA